MSNEQLTEPTEATTTTDSRSPALSDAELQEWASSGWFHRAAKPWRDAGFELFHADGWVDAGFNSAHIAAAWRDAGFDPAEAALWETWRDEEWFDMSYIELVAYAKHQAIHSLYRLP